MNFLTLFDQKESKNQARSNQFLVSGSDVYVHHEVFKYIVERNLKNGKTLIIVDFGDQNNDMENLFPTNQKIVNILASDNIFPNPLRDVKSVIGKSNIRLLGNCIGLDEKGKAKLIKYIEVVKEIISLEEPGEYNAGIRISKLNGFSSNSKVNSKLLRLISLGVISDEEFENIIARYAEVSDVGVDLENYLLLLNPLIDENKGNFEDFRQDTILYLPIGVLNQDVKYQETILGLLMYSLKTASINSKYSILVRDVGKGNIDSIFSFLTTLPAGLEKACFSEDIFALCAGNNISNLLNKFDVHIYSRHNQLYSCAEVERLAGEVKIVQKTFTKTRDYRLGANSLLDMVLNRDKVEAYTTNSPVWEKKYRQEDIAQFQQGTCLIWNKGNVGMYNI